MLPSPAPPFRPRTEPCCTSPSPDNGSGYDPLRPNRTRPNKKLADRLATLGDSGQLYIRAAPGKVTTITATVPSLPPMGRQETECLCTADRS